MESGSSPDPVMRLAKMPSRPGGASPRSTSVFIVLKVVGFWLKAQLAAVWTKVPPLGACGFT